MQYSNAIKTHFSCRVNRSALVLFLKAWEEGMKFNRTNEPKPIFFFLFFIIFILSSDNTRRCSSAESSHAHTQVNLF